jgi:hypothetical protein
MRKTVSFVLLLAMLGGFVFLMASHPTPQEIEPRVAVADAAEAAADAPAATSPAATTPATVGPATPAAVPDPAAPKPVLRVAGLGWELLAPGVLANDGLDPGKASEFVAGGIEAHFAMVADMDALQKMLARGGGDEQGADVALLPLPDFVASYERLRGLDPQVFFVVGWSHGRDALAKRQQTSLGKLPAKDKITVAGAPGRSATLLGLFALQLAGVASDRIELVADDKAMFAAVDRSLGAKADKVDARDLLLTTADATELVPLVAIAPGGYIRRNAPLLTDWARLWLAATARLHSDVPAASRRLAREKGAPEPMDLLAGLGWIRHASLIDNANLAGLSGRGAVTIDELFHRTWALWRGVGVLSTPAPEHAPRTNEIVSRVALSDAPTAGLPDERRPRRGERRALLVHAVPGATLDEPALVADLGFVAGVFARSEIEVRLRKRVSKPGAVLEAAARRFGVERERLREGKTHAGGPIAFIEVYAAE